jgi:hypothetical protein
MNFISFVKNLSIPQKIIAFVLSLYFLLWMISSPLIKHFAKPILIEQGLTISKGASLSFNPFLTQITISDLIVLKNEEKVLAAEELIFRVTLFNLFFDEIAISKFTLNNGFLSITLSEEQTLISGINIKQDANIEVEPVKEEATTAAFPYQVLLPKLIFNDIKLDIDNDNKHHVVKLKQFTIDDLSATEKSQQISISLYSSVDDTEVTLYADADMTDGKGTINSKLSIEDYPVERILRYADDLSELDGAFSLSTEQTITLDTEKIIVNIKEAQISNKNLIVGYEEQFFTLENIQNDINDLVITLTNNEITDLSGSGHLSMQNANVYYQQVEQKIGHFEQLTMADIGFTFEQSPAIKIGKFTIDDIFGSKNETTELPAIVTLKQFSITDIFLSAEAVGVDKVVLDTLTSNIIVNKEKEIANLVSLPITEAEQETIIETEAALEKEITSPQADIIISLGDFALINENQITVLDNSVEPIRERKLFIDTLHLGALSNAEDKKELQTPFEMIGRSNKYAHFDFKGFTVPFGKQPTHHLEGFLKELSLPSLSRYMKQAMQMELKSGQLNADLDVTLTGEELDGNVVVLLQGLETAIADSDEAGALIDQGALPFNMALGMLKDGNGDVELDVPLAGSTSDPEFGMSSIITLITQKAIWMATQDYLMTTFVPYANIVSAAMTVGEFALKLRFDDLEYQVKQIEPNDAQQEYLNSFIALMLDKEDTRVNLCAISTPADIGLKSGEKVVDKKQIQQLKDIGEQREEALKEYLIKQGNIASSRLLLCAPKIDSSKDALPRMELSV